jgi:hypothetical protein
VKWFLTLLFVGSIAAVAVLVPPKTTARLAARGLRAGLDWVSSFRPLTASRATAQKKAKKNKPQAQAALPQGPKAGRDGIVAQPPKEKLGDNDRANLDALLSRSRAP